MSVIENDLNPDTYVGLSLPLGRHQQGVFKRTQTLIEQTKSSIKNLLLTRRGERLGNPNFGSDLYLHLFEPEGVDLENKIEETIRASVKEFLPFVNISEISFSFTGNTIKPRIIFSLNNNDLTIEEVTLELPSLEADTEGDSGGVTPG